jgi:hypothetical protein
MADRHNDADMFRADTDFPVLATAASVSHTKTAEDAEADSEAISARARGGIGQRRACIQDHPAKPIDVLLPSAWAAASWTTRSDVRSSRKC